MARQSALRPRAARTRTVPATEARQNLSKILNDVRADERAVVIEKGGIPVAAVVPLSTLERDRRWMQERAERAVLLERMRAPFEGEMPAELEREADRAIVSVQADQGTRRSRR